MSSLQNLLLNYQKAWVSDKSKFRIYIKSRRIGITWGTALKAVIDGLTTKNDTIFSSADYKTAKEFLGYCKKFAMACNIVCRDDFGGEVIDEKEFSNEWITLPNGNKITIVSSNPTALRGLGGNVVLDEFAWHQDQEALYTAAASLPDWGGQLSILSTHNGAGTVFNDIVEKSKRGEMSFKIFHTTLLDAVADGLAEKMPGEHRKIVDQEARRKAFIQSRRDKCLNEELYNQEYLNCVLSASSILNSDQYDKCIIPDYQVPSEYLGPDIIGGLYIGVDIGRSERGDRTVIWVLEKGEDRKQVNPRLRTVYRTVLCKVLRGVPFAAQQEVIQSVIMHPKTRRCLIEMNGIGMNLAETLGNSHPRICSGFNTSATSKAIILERLAGWVNTQRIALPGDKTTKDDLLSVARVITPAGKVGYSGGTSEGHADRAMACAIALEAAECDQLPDIKIL